MLPTWLSKKEEYIPPKDGGIFIIKTIKTLGNVIQRIRIQKGHEKKKHLPALFKLFLTFAIIIIIAVIRDRMMITAFAAGVLAYLATCPAHDIWNILKAGLGAAGVTFLFLLSAIIFWPEGMNNYIMMMGKVFLSVTVLSIFNHTTQWNHITRALRNIHVPGVVIFIFDITLKYIVLFGRLITDILTSLQLRSVGKNNRKYNSIGGVMGVTFIRGTEMNKQMYEAMICRGFSDDYEGL